MKLTNEQLEALRSCGNAEEAVAKAAAAGYQLSVEEAQKLMALNEYTEIDCEDLEVAGGACTGDYWCKFCENWFKGTAPHTLVVPGAEGTYRTACENCYQNHKDDPNCNWVD